MENTLDFTLLNQIEQNMSMQEKQDNVQKNTKDKNGIVFMKIGDKINEYI